MVTDCPLPCSQQPANIPYPKPHKSNLYPHILLIYHQFNVSKYLSLVPFTVLSSQFFQTKVLYSFRISSFMLRVHQFYLSLLSRLFIQAWIYNSGLNYFQTKSLKYIYISLPNYFYIHFKNTFELFKILYFKKSQTVVLPRYVRTMKKEHDNYR